MLTACTPGGSRPVWDRPGTKRPSAKTSRGGGLFQGVRLDIGGPHRSRRGAGSKRHPASPPAGLEWRQLSSLLVGSPCSAKWSAASRLRA